MAVKRSRSALRVIFIAIMTLSFLKLICVVILSSNLQHPNPGLDTNTSCVNYKVPPLRKQPYMDHDCAGTARYDELDSMESATDSTNLEKPDILFLVVESLSLDKAFTELPRTKKALKSHRALSFTNFHSRRGGTRANIIPLMFGAPYEVNVTTDQSSGTFKAYATVNLSQGMLTKNVLWKVASNNGYTSLHGSTGCGVFIGCHTLRTSDEYIFHDTIGNRTTFDEMFPLGSFYEAPGVDCTTFVEAKSPEDILRCDSFGTYHAHFLQYYQSRRLAAPRHEKFFTFVHLYETHGPSAPVWPLDKHVAAFIDWLGSQKRTVVFFMGDHGNTQRTALDILVPASFGKELSALARQTHSFIIHENIYEFTRGLMTQNLKYAVNDLIPRLRRNSCDQYTRLDRCWCPGIKREFVFSDQMTNQVITYIREKSDPIKCGDLTLKLVKKRSHYNDAVVIDIELVNGAIYRATFTSSKDFHTEALTRYASQANCTPAHIHPMFCVCDDEKFRKAQIAKDKSASG